MSKNFAFPEDVWNIIKDFIPTWKNNHFRKLKNSLEARHVDGRKERKSKFWVSGRKVGIKSLYPEELLKEEFKLSSKAYKTTFRLPWNDKVEKRIANFYDLKECKWVEKYLLNQ